MEEAEHKKTTGSVQGRQAKMGSGQCKNAKEGKRGGKSPSPSQEKHNSADSKAPLTEHAATLNLKRSPSAGRNNSGRGNGASLERSQSHATNDDQIHIAPRSSTIRAVSTTSSNIQVHETEGHSNVTRPPPPPRIHHLSELIDPADLAVDSHIRSPSGNLLAPEQFLTHPDRPRSIRERQEEIREKVRAASRLGVEVDKAEEEKPRTGGERGKKKKKKNKEGKKRGCLLCVCFRGS